MLFIFLVANRESKRAPCWGQSCETERLRTPGVRSQSRWVHRFPRTLQELRLGQCTQASTRL